MNEETIRREYGQKIASGEIDPIKISFVEFQKQFIKEDPSYKKFQQLYSSNVISGQLDPAETTFEEFVKIAKILFKNMDNNSLYVGVISDEDIKQYLLETIDSLSDEDKKLAKVLIQKKNYVELLRNLSENKVVINRVISYYEQLTPSFENSMNLAICYYRYLGDKFRTIESCQVAQQYIKTVGDVILLSEYIYKTGDLKWYESILKQGLKFCKNSGDYNEIASGVILIAQNKELAREIVIQGLKLVTKTTELEEYILMVANKDKLNDLVWARELVQKGISLAKDSNDFSSMILNDVTSLDIAFMLSMESIALLQNDEEKENLNGNLNLYTMFQTDENILKQLMRDTENLTTENLKSKYKKPSEQELKKEYGQAILNETISAKLSFENYKNNYWLYHSDCPNDEEKELENTDSFVVDEQLAYNSLYGISAIAKYLRMEQDLTHEEIHQQAISLCQYLLTEQFKVNKDLLAKAIEDGTNFVSTHFDDYTYRRLLKKLNVWNTSEQLEIIGLFLLAYKKFCTEYEPNFEIRKKFEEDIDSTLIDQFEIEDEQLSEMENASNSIFEMMQASLMFKYPFNREKEEDSSINSMVNNELLIKAAKFNDVSLAQKCLDNGADINYQTNDGSASSTFTPLLYAAWNGHFEVGKFLVDNGADLQAKDRKGYRAHEIASGECGYGNDENQELSEYIYNAM